MCCHHSGCHRTESWTEYFSYCSEHCDFADELVWARRALSPLWGSVCSYHRDMPSDIGLRRTHQYRDDPSADCVHLRGIPLTICTRAGQGSGSRGEAERRALFLEAKKPKSVEGASFIARISPIVWTLPRVAFLLADLSCWRWTVPNDSGSRDSWCLAESGSLPKV